MKTSSIRLGSFAAGTLLAFASAVLFTAATPARAATVLHTFTEDFDGLNNAGLHLQNGWWVSDDNDSRQYASVLDYGDGQVFRLIKNEYAYHSINQSYINEANALTISWTQRALLVAERPVAPAQNANTVGGVQLFSGDPWGTAFLGVYIQRNAGTSYQQMLYYTQWNGTNTVTVAVPRTGEGAFVASNSITYAFSVELDLEAHSYSFTILNAADSSLIWTSPEAIALDPNAAFPKNLRLWAQGGSDGGVIFDDVSLQLIAIPEPGAFAAISGLVLLAFAGLRRRR